MKLKIRRNGPTEKDYLILLGIEKNKYLIVHVSENVYEDNNLHKEGDIEEYDESEIEDTNYKIEKCNIYNTFLFQYYIKKEKK